MTAVAILKAGSTFVALDPSTPEHRWASILVETDARILITSPSHATLFKGRAKCVVVVSSAFVESLQVADSKPFVEVDPQNAALILFTSGSTGQPKGIVQSHGAVCKNS